ncbi:MAG: globin [Candidatus Thiodiazotropha sp. 6PLUC2]
MSTISQDNLKRFQQSLRRVSQKEGFYESFYEYFIAQSDEMAKIFHNRNMAQLIHKLKETLQMVDDVVAGKPGVVLYMEMLGRIHTRLKVERRHLDMWTDALMSTVKSYDDEYDSQVHAAWIEAIEMVTSFMYPQEEQVNLAAMQ